MGQLQVFDFKDHVVRTFDDNGEIYFVANDVCQVLEYVNARDALKKHVDVDDVAKCDSIDSLGRTQSLNCINESGLYSLIFGSKKPEAKKFKRWVTSEVLPTIRRTGRYETEQQEKPQLNAFKEFEGTILGYMKQNAELEYRLAVVEGELEKYQRLERNVGIHGSNLHVVTRDWIKKTKH